MMLVRMHTPTKQMKLANGGSVVNSTVTLCALFFPASRLTGAFPLWCIGYLVAQQTAVAQNNCDVSFLMLPRFCWAAPLLASPGTLQQLCSAGKAAGLDGSRWSHSHVQQVALAIAWIPSFLLHGGAQAPVSQGGSLPADLKVGS